MVAAPVQWTDLETFRGLLQEYEQRSAQYEKDLAEFKASGAEDPDKKSRLEQEYNDLTDLYNRVSGIRQSLAEARDAAAPR